MAVMTTLWRGFLEPLPDNGDDDTFWQLAEEEDAGGGGGQPPPWAGGPGGGPGGGGPGGGPPPGAGPPGGPPGQDDGSDVFAQFWGAQIAMSNLIAEQPIWVEPVLLVPFELRWQPQTEQPYRGWQEFVEDENQIARQVGATATDSLPVPLPQPNPRVGRQPPPGGGHRPFPGSGGGVR